MHGPIPWKMPLITLLYQVRRPEQGPVTHACLPLSSVPQLLGAPQTSSLHEAAPLDPALQNLHKQAKTLLPACFQSAACRSSPCNTHIHTHARTCATYVQPFLICGTVHCTCALRTTLLTWNGGGLRSGHRQCNTQGHAHCNILRHMCSHYHLLCMPTLTCAGVLQVQAHSSGSQATLNSTLVCEEGLEDSDDECLLQLQLPVQTQALDPSRCAAPMAQPRRNSSSSA